MSYRDDVDALAARHDSLERELADKTRELADAAHLLDEAREKRRLPLLDNIRVASPCSAKWDNMLGDDRVRHCIDCNKNVYNLSGMTREEAEELIVAKNGDLCARFFQRADGTILTSDCTVGVSKRRKRKLIAAGAAALLSGGGFAAYHATHKPMPRLHEMAGAIAIRPEPVPDVPTVPLPPPPHHLNPVQPLMGSVSVPVVEKMGKPTMGHISKPKP